MRDIKFRAWDGRAMFEPAQITFNEATWSCDKGRGMSVPFQPHIKLMLFTGLQDKLGRDIFEGDVMMAATGKSVYEVVWKHSGWFRQPINGTQRTTSLYVGYKTQTVIGNIYENENLVTESNKRQQ